MFSFDKFFKSKNLFSIFLLLFVIGSVAGCAGPSFTTHTKTVKLVTVPEDSEIWSDGELIATGTYDASFSYRTVGSSLDWSSVNHTVTVTIKPKEEGYFPATRTINLGPAPATVKVEARIDHSYRETVKSNEIVNKWIFVDISDKYSTETKAWRRLVKSVSIAISDFEILDQSSLYLKSAWRVAGQVEDELRTRSRIIASIEEKGGEEGGFKLKIKIESERVDKKGRFVKLYDRTFRDFLETLETTKSLLGR